MKKVRMTILDIRMVVEEIEAWERKERGNKLTWAILEHIFPFTRQTMYSKPEIREALKKARMTLKMRGNCVSKPILTEEDELIIRRLKNRIKELELQVEEFQKLWLQLKLST